MPGFLNLFQSREQRAARHNLTLNQHHVDINRLFRHLHIMHGSMQGPSSAGSAAENHGGDSSFFFMSPQSDLYRGVEVTGWQYVWDSASKTFIIPPTAPSTFKIRTDFWRGFAFAGEPVICTNRYEPGKMYAIGSGHTYLSGVANSGIPDRDYGTLTLETPAPSWWIAPQSSIQAYGYYGAVASGQECGANFNERMSRWDVIVARCEE